ISRVHLVLCVFALTIFSSLAISASVHCDFNGDGFDDVAVSRSGRINIRYGRATGLTQTDKQEWMTPFTVSALVCGDFNGDGYTDLAVGNPDASFSNTVHRSGEVIIVDGSENGLDLSNPTSWSQATPGIEGVPEEDDHFGAS